MMKSLIAILALGMAAEAFAQSSISQGPVFGFLKRSKVLRRVSLESASAPRWEPIEGNGPFKINQSSDSFLGAGIAGVFERYSMPYNVGEEGWASVGVYPTRSTQVVSSRTHQNSEASLLPFPFDGKSFAQWKRGDTLHWRRDNGVGLFAGVGVGVVSVGPAGSSLSAGVKLLLAGSFQVFMEKQGSNQLYIEVRPGTVKAASLVGNLIVAYGEAGVRIENYRHGLGMFIDPSTKVGADALVLLMQGQLLQAQKLVGELPNDNNRVVSHLSQRRHIGYGQWAVEVPVVPIFSYARRTQLVEDRDSEQDETGLVTNRREVDYSRMVATKVFARYDSEVRGVRFFRDQYGKVQIAWRWEWESSKGNPRRLGNALQRLRGKLDCGPACRFETANISAHKAYVRANVTWSTSLEKLVDSTSRQRSLSKLNRQAQYCLDNELLNRDCLGQVARKIMDLKTPLQAMFGASRSCVPVSFSVGGEYLQQWSQTGEFCFGLHDKKDYRARLEVDPSIFEDDLVTGAYPHLTVDYTGILSDSRITQ